MLNMKNEKILNSLPELYIVMSSAGEYVDFFGGANLESFDNIDNLKNKNLFDFFDNDVADGFLMAIQYCLDNKIDTEYSYSMDTPGIGIKFYKAKISEFCDDEMKNLVIVSIQDITVEKDILDRSYRLSNYDFELQVNALNVIAYKENLQEEKNRYPDLNDTILNIEGFNKIMISCTSQKISDLETYVVKSLKLCLQDMKYEIGRLGPGCYGIFSHSLSNLSIKQAVERVNKELANLIVKSRNNKISHSIKLIEM